jgi:hypothetical protein
LRKDAVSTLVVIQNLQARGMMILIICIKCDFYYGWGRGKYAGIAKVTSNSVSLNLCAVDLTHAIILMDG